MTHNRLPLAHPVVSLALLTSLVTSCKTDPATDPNSPASIGPVFIGNLDGSFYPQIHINMKRHLTFFLLLAVISLAGACKKDDIAPTPSMAGFWVGKYGNGAAAATVDYAFLIKSDGSMKVYANNADTAKASKASGTYFVSGTKINGSYSYSGGTQYSFIATTDDKFTTMSGSWGSGSVTTGNTFFMNKK
ncbi:hypothetical protein [Fibrella arboris]|uniref:hypothetical protein n=1 Tax=Fibrella arboris TaxID=3242486 RepID=UPI003522C996